MCRVWVSHSTSCWQLFLFFIFYSPSSNETIKKLNKKMCTKKRIVTIELKWHIPTFSSTFFFSIKNTILFLVHRLLITFLWKEKSNLKNSMNYSLLLKELVFAFIDFLKLDIKLRRRCAHHRLANEINNDKIKRTLFKKKKTSFKF